MVTWDSEIVEYFIPYTVLAVIMIGLRLRDVRRYSKPRRMIKQKPE
jgi:hypothetical protein